GYLDLKATILAAILAKKGVKTGVVVGVMVERSIEMIVGILGLLKAGGIYLPIDTELPVDRKKYMLEDSGAKLILSKQQIPHIPGDTREVVYLENGQSYNNAGANLDIRVEREATAYVIYTSGSTGKPKGVAVRHRSILNTLMWRKECYKFDRNDIVLQIPSISFDSSVEDIFNALSSGSKLVLIKQSERLNLEYLDTVIAKERITHFLITPALYTVFLEKIPNRLSSLKTVTVAGESFTENLVEEHFKKLKNTRIFNEYGPTENSVCTTVYEFTGDNPKISIGKPISNVTCYILDKYRRVIPLGLFGELCVSGKGLAAGYLNNQELTDLKFVANHYTEQDLLYCTGDLCRWSPDGNIEFLGRVDSQVKIRGFRIELEEIEKSILNFPGIKETVVSVREQENGDKYLCAYIVPGIEFEKSKLSEYLAKELPGYMIPSYFIPLDRIPLTPNGKIDRRALPKPEIESGKDYIAPRDVVEEKLAGIWAGVLFEKSSLPGTPGRIGMDDNFFQLGGHSLKAVIMLSKLHRELNVKVPLAEIFKNPTLEGLAAYIKKTAPDRYVSIEPIEKKEYYALSSAQKRLYILQQMDRKSTAYNMLEILPLTNAPDLTKLKKAFMHLITRHESLRTFFQIVDDQPVQRINDVVNFTIGYNEINADNQVQVEVVKLFDQAFNLAHSPMLRVEIIKTAPAQYFMVLVMHHIISDGISIQVLVHDLMILSTDDHENILPPLRVQYKDFSHWQNNEKNKASMKTQETYWLKEFEGKVPVLTLPTDFPRPDIQLFKGGVLNGEIAVDIDPFKTIAMENGATTFMVLLTIFYVFIYKISGQEDIIIGTPVAGRRHVDLEKIIGMFVNSLPLRNRPGDEKSFVELLQEVRSNTLAAFENQDYQFEDLVEKLAVNRDQRNPIFDVMFIYQEKEFAGKINADTNDYVGSRTSKFDLTLNIMIAGKLWFSFEYSSELFKKKTIERFAQCFKEIVSAVLTDKNSKLKNINITTFLADTTGSEVQEELLGMDF
ncbi:MAG TPA: amino acid adenylation domain-containing protein, partial [Candidatus Deferrimicrobium sp.]|nr:amino acid adenylation domain-containing protein [Candidatus Deferrimicrobium sp.]